MRETVMATWCKVVDVKTTKSVRVSGNLADLPENRKADANHAAHFEVPLYNVSKQQTKIIGLITFGRFAISDQTSRA
jgi:hypothetical protein